MFPSNSVLITSLFLLSGIRTSFNGWYWDFCDDLPNNTNQWPKQTFFVSCKSNSSKHVKIWFTAVIPTLLCWIYLIVMLPIAISVALDHSLSDRSSTIVKSRQGEKVFLPCHMNDVAYKLVKWMKDEKIIARSDNLVDNGNFKLHENNTLEISEISLEDDGDYVCEVLRVDPWKPIMQIITVEVLYPPQIKTYPESGMVDVEKGKEVVLTCEVSGVPKPSIRWYHEEKEIELLYNRESLNIDRVTLKLAGLYQCIAANNIGEATSKNFIVNVIYPPEISVEKSWIHTAIDMRSEISCNVFANPPAKLDWYRDGNPVKIGGRIDMHVSSDRHTLLIRHIKDTDFGNYMCKASNILGSSEQFVQLSGIPNTPLFKKSSRKLGLDAYKLIWQVDCYSSIIQYVLKFREREEDAPWKRIVIPSDGSAAGPIYTQSFNITGLQPFSQYEAVVMARNRFGWSRPSPPYVFATEGADFSTTDEEQSSSDETSYTITDVTRDLVSTSDNEISSKYSRDGSNAAWKILNSSTSNWILPLLCIVSLIYANIT